MLNSGQIPAEQQQRLLHLQATVIVKKEDLNKIVQPLSVENPEEL